jgi:hypothetical protein
MTGTQPKNSRWLIDSALAFIGGNFNAGRSYMCSNDLDGKYELGSFEVEATINGDRTTYEISAVGLKGEGSTLAAALSDAAAEFVVADMDKNDPIAALKEDAGKLQDMRVGLPAFAGKPGSISPPTEKEAMTATMKRDEAVRMIRDAAEKDFVNHFCLAEGGFKDGAGEAISDATAPMLGVVASIVREWMHERSSGEPRPMTLRTMVCIDILKQLGLSTRASIWEFGATPVDETKTIEQASQMEMQ